MSLFFAGMDTTGITTGMVFYYLALYPRVCEKIVHEIQAVLKSSRKLLYLKMYIDNIYILKKIDIFLYHIKQ